MRRERERERERGRGQLDRQTDKQTDRDRESGGELERGKKKRGQYNSLKYACKSPAVGESSLMAQTNKQTTFSCECRGTP